jgi:RND superfamily putative drug exporter
VSSIGFAGAIGIATALVYALVLLPAALLLFGRRLFWPFAPRVGQPDPAEAGVWARVGRTVVRRPVLVVVAGVLLLAALTAGISGVQVGLSQTEQFRERVEAILGQETIARSFPGGTSQPTVVIANRAAAEPVAEAAGDVAGVASARVTDGNDDVARVDVVFEPEPGTAASRALVGTLRSGLDRVPGADALVGGPEAQAVDERAAAQHDRLLVAPLILAIVFVVLLAVLRSLVAAVLLVLTVVATFAASLGASWFAFDRLFGFPALDLAVPLLAFLFLVALGVDYAIFLTTGAREETPALGVRGGIVQALAVTGGVITSAGILLAAVFTVLGVLPLITLTQLGVVVGFGVLLDTLLVRSVLVPALVSLTGRYFWWPSSLGRGGKTDPQPARVADHLVAPDGEDLRDRHGKSLIPR